MFTGTFRGCDSVVTFAGPRTFISLSRPGPATTPFIMERASATDEGDADAIVEQMNLRSDDPAADALLSDPRVVTALRGAPGEFQYCDVTEKWGHTSLPEDAISHYDGSIVTLHALVSAAAALPASGGAPLDLSSTDPGSAAAGRSDAGDADTAPPRVVDAEEFDAEIEDLGDDLEPAPVDPNAIPFEPRKPGRAGHLRLVKSDADGSDGGDVAGGEGAGGEGAGLAAHPSEVIGKETRVAVYAGRPVRLADIGPPAVIERNQIVTLVYRRSGLLIATEARALGRGGVGDMLKVMNLASRSTVTGQVDEAGRVIVGPSARLLKDLEDF